MSAVLDVENLWFSDNRQGWSQYLQRHAGEEEHDVEEGQGHVGVEERDGEEGLGHVGAEERDVEEELSRTHHKSLDRLHGQMNTHCRNLPVGSTMHLPHST